MWKILANDGLEETAKNQLLKLGFTVDTKHIPLPDLIPALQEYQGLLVRSATKLRKETLDQTRHLKFIGRGGVGMDNIDVEYARSIGIHVFNTPAASSRSVAELAIAHIFAVLRKLHLSNRELLLPDASLFNRLKKQAASGKEVEGKVLGIMGIGRIGKELAKMALGLGMKVQAYDPFVESVVINHSFNNQEFSCEVPLVDFKSLIQTSDILSLHLPFNGSPILATQEFEQMKQNAIIINTSRGENIDESALLKAIELQQIAGAGLDVYNNEPTINQALLRHPNISVSAHIGANTIEAQEKIGTEIVNEIVRLYQNEIGS